MLKKILIVFMLIVSLFSVNAYDIMNEEEVNASVAFIDSMDFVSLNAYNDYTVPKKDGEVNLLDYLGYSGGIRDQGRCGSCWVWSGMLSTEVALSIEAGVKERLSIQYFDSNLRDEGFEPCEGGNWAVFSAFTNYLSKLVPWTDYTDKDYSTENQYDLPSSEISDEVYYPLEMDYLKFDVESRTGKQVEELFKDYLDHGKVIGFAYYLPQRDDWMKFYDFWGNNHSDDVVDMDSLVDDNTWTNGGGHGVNIVGYNDIERYWIVSNSWADNDGKRPDGTFKMSMDLDYDAKRNVSGNLYSMYAFWVYDYEFGSEKGLRVEPEVDSKVNIDSVLFDKKTVNAGDVITTSTKVSNNYEYMNLQNVRVSYYIPKLGLKRSVGPFDIEMFEDVMKRVYVDIPKSASAGVYDVRIVLQTEDTKEVRYEEIEVK